MQEFNQRGGMEMGGWVPSAIQLVCVNSPVFRVENNVGNLVFWRDVS